MLKKIAGKKVKIISILVIALILVFASLIAYELLFGYKYEFSSPDGFLFVSNEKNPETYLAALGEKHTFLVSPAMYESSTINNYMGNASNLFIVVLNGNDKNAVSLIRVFNSANELIYCKTNLGDVKTEVTLSKDECLQFLDSSGAVKIIIDFPSEAEFLPRVVVSENELQVIAKDKDGVSMQSFAALKLMYPNAAEIIQKTNLLTQKVTG